MIVNWNAKATKPFIQPESWEICQRGMIIAKPYAKH